MKPASPYLTADEAREYLRIPTMNAFYVYRHRTELRAYRRGGKLLFKQADLDNSLDVERPRLVSRRAS
jgi:hypothetical protein